MSALYLIPVTLGDVEHRRVLPEYNREVILSIRHFIVECTYGTPFPEKDRAFDRD